VFMRVDVLHVVPAYHPARGGVEVLVENLAEGLRDSYGISSAVLAPALPGERNEDYVHRGSRVHSISVPSDLMAISDVEEPRPLPPDKTIQYFTEIYSAIRRVCMLTAPALLHVHASSALAPGAISIAATLGIPVVVHVHGTIHSGDQPNFRARVRDAEWVCAIADAVAASIRSECRRTGPIDIIRNGVVDSLSTTVPSNPFSPSVAMVGRLSPEKGFDDGLRAMAMVRERTSDVRIRLVGSGPMTNRLHEIARELNLVDSVDYFGQLENSEAMRVIAGSDLVLIPSREEGFSLVAVEAALLERPVVATTAGGLPETVVDGQTGLLVQPGALSAMAAAIQLLLDDPGARMSMGQHARQRALNSFGMERFVADIAAMYARIWCPGEHAETRK